MLKKLFFTLLTSAYAFAQTGPTKTWVTQPPATISIGSTYDLEISYDAGDDGSGTDYLIGGTNLAHVQFSIVEIGTGGGWKAGVNVGTTGGTHSGNASKTDWTIPSLPLSSELASGNYYVMRVAFQNNQNQWASGAADVPITLEAAMGDSWDWNPISETYSSGTTLDIEVKYTSDLDIAANGIRFTLWTITDGTVDGTNLFSDIWHAALGNSNVLPAGTNMTATITINVPAGVQNNNTMRPSSDLGANWDPNAGDAGNNYVNHATTPAPTYTYQFRPVSSNDTDFTPLLPGQNNFTVTSTLSLNDSQINTLKVFPNPSNGLLNINNIKNTKTITIHNVLGQEVKRFNAQKTIDISTLVKGVYFLKTDSGFSKKIIKN